MEKDKIKLLIWDLDETLWDGTLSDGDVRISERNKKLIVDATNCGVINTICSKNDKQTAEKKLQELGLLKYFVFNSINWSPKGERVKQIIEEMQLRPQNALFIDDNILNLQEAKKNLPQLMIATPESIIELSKYFKDKEKKDLKNERLNQYKLLEKKKEFKAKTGDNIKFLYECNIDVQIKDDCLNHIERIHDLILRSNQLNFTKNRSTKEELIETLNQKDIKSGYVEVEDNFGKYGIVGFFAIKENSCLHFVFSCRTLNMGVEQYVYNVLGRPQIEIQGEVASSLEGKKPEWINTGEKQKKEKTKIEEKVVIKGPCDLSQVFSFVEDSQNIIQEFVYVGENGVSIEGVGHSAHVVQNLTLSQKEKEEVVKELPFGDFRMYDTHIFDDDVDVVYYSLFTDPNLGLYKKKDGRAIVAFGEWTNDLTDEKKWNDYIEKRVFVANCSFTRENLQHIKDNYEFIGRLQPKEIVDNLEFIYKNINKKAKLILNLGSEIEYLKNDKLAYKDRHIYNRELNNLVKEWSKNKENIYLIEVTKFIKSQKSFTNNINHFVKSVYYDIFREISAVIGMKEKNKIEKIKVFFKRIINKVKRLLKKMKI